MTSAAVCMAEFSPLAAFEKACIASASASALSLASASAKFCNASGNASPALAIASCMAAFSSSVAVASFSAIAASCSAIAAASPFCMASPKARVALFCMSILASCCWLRRCASSAIFCMASCAFWMALTCASAESALRSSFSSAFICCVTCAASTASSAFTASVRASASFAISASAVAASFSRIAKYSGVKIGLGIVNAVRNRSAPSAVASAFFRGRRMRYAFRNPAFSARSTASRMARMLMVLSPPRWLCNSSHAVVKRSLCPRASPVRAVSIQPGRVNTAARIPPSAPHASKTTAAAAASFQYMNFAKASTTAPAVIPVPSPRHNFPSPCSSANLARRGRSAFRRRTCQASIC